MHLVHRSADPVEPGWTRTIVAGEGVALRRGASGGVEIAPADADLPNARVVPFDESGAERAALVVARETHDLFVGGRRPLPVSVLEERTEIVLGGARIYFAVREPLAIAHYEGDASCGVCGEPARGCEAIACNGCAAVTHEGALAGGGERLCFTHRDACPGCQLRREDFDWAPGEDDDA